MVAAGGSAAATGELIRGEGLLDVAAVAVGVAVVAVVRRVVTVGQRLRGGRWGWRDQREVAAERDLIEREVVALLPRPQVEHELAVVGGRDPQHGQILRRLDAQ